MKTRYKIIIVGIVLVSIIFGTQSQFAPSVDESIINSFWDCVEAGNPMMESYPRQCYTQDGKHFVEEIT